MPDVLQPPRLRAEREESTPRHATWLELFYDLVFVVAIAELGHRLSAEVTVAGVLGFAFLFLPVWWSWIGETFYANRFDTDDTVYRLLTGVQMLAVAALAVTIHNGLGAGSVGFALAYVGTRVILIVQYHRTRRHVPKAHELSTRYIRGFGLAAAVWLLSVFVPPPYRFGLWIVGLAIDFATPLTARNIQQEVPPHTEHLPERFGLLTIIVLGESIVSVVSGITEVNWEITSVLAGVLGFVAAFSIWWIYFDNIDEDLVTRTLFAGQVWMYAHLPLLVGLTAAGIGIEHLITAEIGALPAADRWLICGGVGLCLLSLAVIRLASVATGQHNRLLTAGLLVTGVAVFGVAAIGINAPLIVAAIIAIACSVQVILDVLDPLDAEPSD